MGTGPAMFPFYHSANDPLVFNFPSAISESYFMVWGLLPAENSTLALILKNSIGDENIMAIQVTPASISAYRGNNFGTLLGSVSSPTIINNWFCLECHGVEHDSAGVIQVKIDGVICLNLSAVDTKPGSSTNFDRLSVTGTQWPLVGPLLVNDTSGAEDNSWVGIRKFKANAPTGDSSTNNAMSKSTGSNGYALVDEVPSNDDTDYVYSIVNGQKQGFTFPAFNLPSHAAPKSITSEAMSRKETDGQEKIGIRANGTESSATKDLPTSFGIIQNRFTKNPNGNVNWTYSSVDNNVEALLESVI
jgi:hypothetical protein